MKPWFLEIHKSLRVEKVIGITYIKAWESKIDWVAKGPTSGLQPPNVQSLAVRMLLTARSRDHNFNKADNLLSHVRKKSRGRHFQDMFFKFIREPWFFHFSLLCHPSHVGLDLPSCHKVTSGALAITACTTVSTTGKETISSLASFWEWGDPWAIHLSSHLAWTTSYIHS